MSKQAMMAAVVVLAAAAVSAASDWPQFGGPDRNMVSPETGLVRAWPQGGPKVLWTVPVGEGYGGAAVVGSEVYLLDHQNDQDVLQCLDLAKGGPPKWTFAYDAPGKLDHPGSRQVPTVSAKYVYAIGPFGDFHCLDRATHRVVWKKHLLQDWDGSRPSWGVAQSPLLYKNAVIVAPLSKSVGVVALDQATGRELWRSAPISRMCYVSPVLVRIGGLDQIVQQTGTTVAGIDVRDGRILWKYAYKCSIPIPYATPVGADGLFITGGYNAGSDLVRVMREGDAFAVKPLWRSAEIGSQTQQPFAIKGFIYALCNTNERADGLVCFASDGQVKWQTGRQPSLDKGSAILTGDGLLYQMDGATGELYIVEPSPEGFKPLDKVKLLGGREIWAPMALSDGKLVIRDQREMKCIDLRPR